jgi:molybdenum cofactor cytidylyltransferase
MIAGILLAAGESKRFRPENKLLYKIYGKPLLEYLLEAFLQSNVDVITIVVGYQKDEIIELSNKIISSSSIPVTYVENKGYNKGGMSSSIIKGMQSVINSDAVLITPADIPFITTDVINEVIKYYNLNKPKIIIPTFEQRKGHPILLSSDLFNEIISISEELRGLKEITTKYNSEAVFLPTEEKGIIRDFDTKEDLQSLFSK